MKRWKKSHDCLKKIFIAWVSGNVFLARLKFFVASPQSYQNKAEAAEAAAIAETAQLRRGGGKTVNSKDSETNKLICGIHSKIIASSLQNNPQWAEIV